MRTVDVVVNCESPLSIRARQVCGMFDCPPTNRQSRAWRIAYEGDDRPWKVGLIVGPSGSGKSTIAKELFGNPIAIEWDGATVVDSFEANRSVEEITNALGSVGFSTIPAWIRPYSVLSNGEKFRADMARAMLCDRQLVLIDEFTSVVDRQVAKIVSNSIAKWARRQDEKQFVAVSCHSDIVDWLQPDWVIEADTQQFTWRSLRQRPSLSIEVARISRDAWKVFKDYHYLTGELNSAAQCFGLWVEGKLASFLGVLHRPHNVVRNLKVVSRIVTLPDFQGLGLAFRLLETVASAYKSLGFRFRNYPTHPQFVRAHRADNWACLRTGGKRTSKQRPTGTVGSTITNQRPCSVFEYVGSAMDIAEAKQLTSG